MKAVLMSTQPKWCELIASGKKTVEVRKSAPKLETRFKCYIYETQDKQYEKSRVVFSNGRGFAHATGKVIGEFVCDKIYEIGTYWATDEIYSAYSDEIDDELREEGLDNFDVTCLTEEEIIEYLGTNRDGYGWHISDLKIYDKPKELSEFLKPCPFPSEDCDLMCPHAIGEYHGDGIGGDCEFVGCDNKITRPPQSWCYVEEIEE